MDSKYCPRIGDIVAVNFNNAQYTLCNAAEVLGMPCGSGDSWVLKDVEHGVIHYMSEGVTITKKL